jgi:hypothetical protein
MYLRKIYVSLWRFDTLESHPFVSTNFIPVAVKGDDASIKLGKESDTILHRTAPAEVTMDGKLKTTTLATSGVATVGTLVVNG